MKHTLAALIILMSNCGFAASVNCNALEVGSGRPLQTQLDVDLAQVKNGSVVLQQIGAQFAAQIIRQQVAGEEVLVLKATDLASSAVSVTDIKLRGGIRVGKPNGAYVSISCE